MTKELIERLYASDVASALTNEAARAIEALQARVADQSAQLTRHTNLIDQLQEERCKLAAELAAARAQEPVSHRYRFTHPISGEPVWRDSSPTWNGQCVQEVQPLFAAPVPPVREPLSDNTIAALRQAIVQPARQVPTTNYVQPVPDHCDRITWRNRYYHLPLAAELSAARAQEPLTEATKASCALGYEECSHRCGTPHVCCDHYVEPEPIATPIPPVREPLSDEEVDALGDL